MCSAPFTRADCSFDPVECRIDGDTARCAFLFERVLNVDQCAVHAAHLIVAILHRGNACIVAIHKRIREAIFRLQQCVSKGHSCNDDYSIGGRIDEAVYHLTKLIESRREVSFRACQELASFMLDAFVHCDKRPVAHVLKGRNRSRPPCQFIIACLLLLVFALSPKQREGNHKCCD